VIKMNTAKSFYRVLSVNEGKTLSQAKRVANWLASEFMDRNDGMWTRDELREIDVIRLIEKTSLPKSLTDGLDTKTITYYINKP